MSDAESLRVRDIIVDGCRTGFKEWKNFITSCEKNRGKSRLDMGAKDEDARPVKMRLKAVSKR